MSDKAAEIFFDFIIKMDTIGLNDMTEDAFNLYCPFYTGIYPLLPSSFHKRASEIAAEKYPQIPDHADNLRRGLP